MRVCNPACQKRQAHMKRRSRCMWMQTSQKNRIAERDQYTCGKRPILMWKETNSRKRPIHMWKETHTAHVWNSCVHAILLLQMHTILVKHWDVFVRDALLAGGLFSHVYWSLFRCVMVSAHMCIGLFRPIAKRDQVAIGHVYIYIHIDIVLVRDAHMGWLRSAGSMKLKVSFAGKCLFCRALLHKRPVILSILPTEATQ